MASRTIIGSTITVDGQIEGAEELVIQGMVKGSIVLKENLFIEASGVVEANVETQNVEISGELRGDIVAVTKVEIKREGRMTGDIRAPRVLIADGAQFKGRVDMERH